MQFAYYHDMASFICDIIMNIIITLKTFSNSAIIYDTISKMTINYNGTIIIYNALITYYTTIVYNLL